MSHAGFDFVGMPPDMRYSPCMVALRKQNMSVAEFLAWSDGLDERWELFDGVPVAMAPERLLHGRAKLRVARCLEDAIGRGDLSCEAVLDSVGVAIDSRNSYQPDALVYCGDPASPDTRLIENPVVVVEVLSPSNALKDLRDKLQGYFRVASIRHYLIVDPDKRIVIHHARGDDHRITTCIVNDGSITLDPPGLVLASADVFRAG
jgi:Uma2 family endonuclease